MSNKTQIKRKEAIVNYYDKTDKYDSNKSNDDINNRNLWQSMSKDGRMPSQSRRTKARRVKICENPCNRED